MFADKKCFYDIYMYVCMREFVEANELFTNSYSQTRKAESWLI